MGYFYTGCTLLFTIYGQIVLKWRINNLGILPTSLFEKIIFLIKMIFDPFVFSSFFSAFIASLFWMAALTKFEISKIYPFMSLSAPLVFFLSIFLLGETFTWGKVIGLLLVILGTVITVRY